jgi:hypothetical protein
MIRARSLRRLAFASPLLLCACGALFGSPFDGLTQNGASPDASSAPDAEPDANDAGDAMPDAPHLDADADADAIADADADAGPNPWSGAYAAPNATGDVFETGGRIAALSRVDALMDTFVIGFDTQVYSTGWRRFGDGLPPWKPGYLIKCTGVTFVPGGGVAAVSPNEHWIYLYSIDKYGQLYQPGTWHDIKEPEPWTPPPPPLVQPASDAERLVAGGSLAAIAFDEQNVVVLTIGQTGWLWVAAEQKAGVWTGAKEATGQFMRFKAGGGIAAVATGPNDIQTFAIGSDGQLWSAGFHDANSWKSGYPINPTSTVRFPPGAEIAATYMNGKIETWVIGADQHLWNAGTFDGANWQPPYKVPVPGDPIFSAGGGIAAAPRASGILELYTINSDLHLWNVATRAALAPAHD